MGGGKEERGRQKKGMMGRKGPGWKRRTAKEEDGENRRRGGEKEEEQ